MKPEEWLIQFPLRDQEVKGFISMIGNEVYQIVAFTHEKLIALTLSPEFNPDGSDRLIWKVLDNDSQIDLTDEDIQIIGQQMERVLM